MRFLSTPSVRRATLHHIGCGLTGMISIHALRAEGDGTSHPAQIRFFHFYPRPPCGGRQAALDLRPRAAQFLSTPSVRRATFLYALDHSHKNNFYPRPPCGGRLAPGCRAIRLVQISIHALRAEGDPRDAGGCWACGYFYPRPPCGGRRRDPALCPGHADFYPRPPCGGRPVKRYMASGFFYISIHALRAEGDSLRLAVV